MTDKRSVVISNPAFERATEEGYPYIHAIYEAIKETYKVGYCNKENATKECVWNKIKELNPRTFIGFGHGNTDIFTGHNFDIIFQVGKVPKELVEGKIFLMLSCLTAKELGKHFVEDLNAWAYLGWDEEYVFWLSHKDEFLGTIRDAWIEFFIGSLYTLKDVYDYIYRKYTEYYEKYKDTLPHIAETFLHDRDHMKLLGDEYAWTNKEPHIYETILDTVVNYSDEKIDWETRRFEMQVRGKVKVKDTDIVVPNVKVKCKIYVDGELDVEYEDVTNEKGVFEFYYVKKLNTYGHIIKVVVESEKKADEKDTEVDIYLPSKYSEEIHLPILKEQLQVKIIEKKLELVKESFPYSMYKATIRFQLVDKQGNVVKAPLEWLDVIIEDKEGKWKMHLEYENDVIVATQSGLVYESIRFRDRKVKFEIVFKPEDPRYAEFTYTDYVILKATAWIYIIIALIILAIILLTQIFPQK